MPRRTAVTLAPTPHAFALRPLEVATDLRTVHAWMNDPEVAEFWRKALPLGGIESYLHGQLGSAHSHPCIGELDGVPMSYWELYRADLDALADHYPARPHDAGVHLLVGPADYRGRGLAAPMLATVSSWQLAADPRADRVVAEPDIENRRSILAFERAGFCRAGDIDLPAKRAALMVRNRRGARTGGESLC